MAAPHATVLGGAHEKMHSHARVALLQRCPEAHCVPVPQEGPPGQLLGMSRPHATMPGVVGGHDGTHAQRPDALHTSPGLQRVPTPGQLAPEHALVMA